MTTTIEHGAVRQVWFAPADDPNNKSSFLIRDDAYSEREASFGRTLRLGDPVDLGPFGQWRQTNWSGGNDQESWRDEAMFELGTADVSERKGSVKLWNGWTGFFGSTTPNRIIGHMLPAAQGLGDANPLLFAERVPRPVPGGSPTGDFRLWKYDLVSGSVTLIATFGSEIQAIAAVGDVSGGSIGLHLVGLRNGELFLYNQSTGSVGLDHAAFSSATTSALTIGYHSICAFNNGTYFTADSRLYRRTTTGTSAGNAEYTHVATLPEVRGCNGAVVWNNRLWLLCIMASGRTGLFVSDGFTAQLALTIPGNFSGFDICAHYGSLYIRGASNHYGAANDVRSAVYKYTGSSLSLLWEDDESNIDYENAGGLISHGRHLVWSKFGSTTMGLEAGVWMYDAEEDAIYIGPTRQLQGNPYSPTSYTSALCSWNNNITAAFYDPTDFGSGNKEQKWCAYVNRSVRPRAVKLDGTTTVDTDKVQDSLGSTAASLFGGVGFGHAGGLTTTKSQCVLSSAYDAGLPGEKKVWVKGYLHARIPVSCRVRMVLLLDEDPTEHPIHTETYNTTSGWRDIQFSAECADHGIHHASSKVRYKLYVENTNPSVSPESTPEVDVVGLDYLPSPARRSIYHLNVIAEDGQARLNGTANPLTTRDAIVAKLKEYWAAARPVLFWPPSSSTSTPSDDGIPVMMSDFLDQSYRITSDGSEVASNVQFNLLQVA